MSQTPVIELTTVAAVETVKMPATMRETLGSGNVVTSLAIAVLGKRGSDEI
jgi:hypothetical protein